MKKILAMFFTLFLLTAVLSGCSGANTSSTVPQSGVSTADSDELLVFCNANFPPFEFMKGTQISGVDVEIANAIGAKLGKKATMKDTDFDGIITALASGKADLAISGITITEKRKAEVDFSKPYVKSVQYLILKNDSAIKTMEDLAGKNIGTPLGYTGQFAIEEEIEKGVLKDKACKVTHYDSPIDGSLDLLNDRIDAVIMDEYVAKKIAADDENLTTIKLVRNDGSDVSEEYGVAVPKGNPELLATINTVIDELISQGKIEEWVISYSV